MTKKIRVLESIRQGMVGGGETHVYDLSTRLNKELFEPIVLSFTDGEMVTALRDSGIETHVIHTTRPFDTKVVQSVISLIKERDIDIVHAHGTRAASNVLKAAKKVGKPVIYTVHGWSFNLNQSWPVKFLRKQIEGYIARRTNLNICVSESNRSTGKKELRGFESIVINNGVSLEKFDHSISSFSIATEIGKKEGEIWLGFLARMTFQKDPLTLLRAFKIALEKKSNLRLLMVGSGELEQEVREFVTKERLHEKVKMLPFRADVPAILSAIDIYCLPSLWEGLPIGILEAMAMKKPVIATRVDGSKEIVNDNVGVLIEKENVDEMAKAMIDLSSSQDRLSSMGENAYQMILKSFSVEQMVEKTEGAYQRIL
ncbi:glycosyltransferase family 4 protein [Reichenbachiella ulvae]|uniref:Glycosyltransferase family 4 protein n=1 Tax=Reichenbachiella ulvae TaxID=2980104 RepID=A0ABT3CNI5_9BACT|nr:glycosyltransferase family 4 protein [Reichenbachiella ulvae]MCV9385029.1 glycosyltransferase family 4 protein [Reichenbachiella ulvae]